jgi:hypothetical protein
VLGVTWPSQGDTFFSLVEPFPLTVIEAAAAVMRARREEMGRVAAPPQGRR